MEKAKDNTLEEIEATVYTWSDATLSTSKTAFYARCLFHSPSIAAESFI